MDWFARWPIWVGREESRILGRMRSCESLRAGAGRDLANDPALVIQPDKAKSSPRNEALGENGPDK